MECVHEFIFAPHRVCCKCGVIDDEVCFDAGYISRKVNIGPDDHSMYIYNEPLPTVYTREGQSQFVTIGKKTIRVETNWMHKRTLIGVIRIRNICINLNAEYLISVATEQYKKWLKHPWVTNPQSPHTLMYRSIAYTAVWYAMRKFHFPMTFKRFESIVEEYQDVRKYHNKLLILIRGLQIEFPSHDLSHLTEHLCEIYRYDAKFQERLCRFTTKHDQFNKILTQKAVKLAKIIPCRGHAHTLALTIMVYSAMEIESYLIQQKLAHPLPQSDVIGYSHFMQVFGVERTYIKKCIQKIEPQLHKYFARKVEA